MGDGGLGMGNGGLVIGDWAQSPIPNPQSPIPNPHLIIIFENKNYLNLFKFIKLLLNKIYKYNYLFIFKIKINK